MSTTVWLGTSRVKLSDADLLGVGGEGSVFAMRDRAVKIYHPATDAAARAKRDLSTKKLEAFPRALPDAVVAPLEIARDDAGAAVGYAMRIVRGTEVARLAARALRERISTSDVLALFSRIRGVVSALHARGIVLGDFNDANVLFDGPLAQGQWPRTTGAALSPSFIDADSMQLPGLPCVVAHERFLDPALYGKDLAAAPAFSCDTDWYAFTVMLFASLLCVHPYGGTHKALPTMLRRAEARHSVLRVDVVYPRAALASATLSDDLLARFTAVFDRGDRGAFPEALLATRFVRCGCGAEHARRACPVCTARVAVPDDVSSGCRCAVVLRTRGRVVGAEVRGGALAWVVEEDGVVTGALPERFAVVDGWIMDLVRGTRVGQVLEGQTWLRAGDRMGIGFYRTGSITEVFVFRTARGGVARAAIDGPGAVRPRDRIVDADAAFDGETALLTLVLDRDGRRLHALHIVGADGSVVASACGAPDESPLFAAPSGRCLSHGMVLAPTDDGLFLSRGLVPEKSFPETRPYVTSQSRLLPGPGGSVYVVDTRSIAHLSLI